MISSAAQIVAIILGWYMFSYTLPQTLMTKLSLALGNRLATPISLAVCSISSLLIPPAAYLGWKWVVACRLLNGVAGAGIMSGMLRLLEDWMRYDEISSGLTVSQFMLSLFGAFCPLLSGQLAAIHWSMVFYVPSYITLALCALWLVLVTDEPHQNWLISERELNHLSESELVETDAVVSKISGDDSCKKRPSGAIAADSDDELELKPDSWTQILKLPQLYAYMIVFVLNSNCFTAFYFVLPTYLRQFLKIGIAENGLYCFVIQAGILLGVSWPHQVLKLLIKMHFTMTQARIIAQAIASVVMASTLIYVGLFHQYQLALFILNRCFFGTDVIVTGSMMSNFGKAGLSSLVFAIVNTVGHLSITGTSPLIGWLLDYTGSSRLGWRVIFCGLGVSQLVLLLTFALFVDSEPIKFKNSSSSRNNKQKRTSPPEDGRILSNVFAIDDYPGRSLDGKLQSFEGQPDEPQVSMKAKNSIAEA
jgi:MFS family permease